MGMRFLVDGRQSNRIAADDRGVAYGDGLFETMLARRGTIPLWPRHFARLALGCERLRMPQPDRAVLEAELAVLLADWDDCVVRLTLTRGEGASGYTAKAGAATTRILHAREVPRLSRRVDESGIAVAMSEVRLGEQPLLAGIKHLNRLEQVLARTLDPSASELLMCDAEGRVVGASAANVFAVIDGELTTPGVARCGVAGVARSVITERLTGVVRDVVLVELESATEVFLSNAVRGVVPVASIGDRRYGVGPAAEAARAALAAEGFQPPRAA
ncbi:MAG TPA: aminodeoxychorismate lyase [Xanthomonadales bacterium]|nr:aminodeoxychorismate lyase [Xanthomonadales bacterium]